MEKKRKVSKYMTPYVEMVLERDNIQYTILTEEEFNFFNLSVSNNRFSEVVEDAIALEEQMRLYDNKILVVSLKTVKNKEKLKRLNPKNKPFTLREGDVEKYMD